MISWTLTALIFLIVWKIFMYWWKGRVYTSTVKLHDKIVVITGANTGIGKCCAEDFCRRGARVIILCRNDVKALAAINDIKSRVGQADITFYNMDLASLKSIKKCADRLNRDLDRIDILLNNAGVMACPPSKTEDGFEMQIGTNHFGHFYLTNLLLPLLRKAGEGSGCRVVTVSSLAHEGGKMKWEDINYETNKYSPFDAYGQSKLANVLFSNHLSELEKDNGIHTYALHPGVVVSELGRHIEQVYGKFVLFCFAIFVGPFTKTTENGAQTSIYCCIEPSLANHTGRYYSDCQEKLASAAALDKCAGKKLWDISCNLTKLS